MLSTNLLQNHFVNKQLIKKRFTKSLDTYEQQAKIQLHIARTLADKATVYLPEMCESILEIGCGTGFLTRAVLSRISVKELYLNDLMDIAQRKAQIMGDVYQQTEVVILSGDAEKITFPKGIQGVLSASTLQWMVDLPTFFGKVSDALRPNGVFLFNTFGPNNLHEIKSLMETGLHYPDKTELQELLSTSFELVEMWEETTVCCFDSARLILRHLQETGVTATTNGFRWNKSNLQTFEEKYMDRYSQDGKVTLTWHVYYFICKKKL